MHPEFAQRAIGWHTGGATKGFMGPFTGGQEGLKGNKYLFNYNQG